jgi:MFS family permease
MLSTGVAFVFGIWVLTSGLGYAPFDSDELIQQAISESLDQGRGATLPSGATYTRGRDVSELARVFRRFIDDPEVAGRAPAVAFGILNLVLFGYIGWTVAGAWGSFWAVLILAVFPPAIAESRRLRFYSEHLTLMLVALFAVWQTVRFCGTKLYDKRGLVVGWIWAGIALVALALGTRLQSATLGLAATASAIVLLAALLDLKLNGWAALRISVPVQLGIGIVVGGFLVLTLRADLIAGVLETAFSVPLWASGKAGDPRKYFWVLSSELPLVTSLYPLALLGISFRNWRLAVFLGLWFTVPFLVFSLVLPFKNIRYLLGAIPAFLLTGSVAAVIAAGSLEKRLHAFSQGSRLTARMRNALTVAGVTIVAAAVVVTSPAFTKARKVPSTRGLNVLSLHATEDWRGLSRVIGELDDSARLPVGTVDGLAALFYVGRADFVIQRDDLFEASKWAAWKADLAVPRLANFDDVAAQGLPDFYSGLPVLTRPEAIREQFGADTDVLLIVDESRWASRTQIDEELKRLLLADGLELCGAGCGSLRLYRWSLEN